MNTRWSVAIGWGSLMSAVIVGGALGYREFAAGLPDRKAQAKERRQKQAKQFQQFQKNPKTQSKETTLNKKKESSANPAMKHLSIEEIRAELKKRGEI